MSFEENLAKENIKLPNAPQPVGSYVAFKKSEKLLFISGQISIDDSDNLIKGKLGKDLKTEDGYNAAVRCAINIIAQAKKACDGDLSKIKSCIKLTGFVNCANDFTKQPLVINGCSDLMKNIFGEKGVHARAAVGVNSLPLGFSVEIEAIFQIQI